MYFLPDVYTVHFSCRQYKLHGILEMILRYTEKRESINYETVSVSISDINYKCNV